MIRFVRFMLRWRVAILAAVVGISASAAWMVSRATIASTIGGLFLGESPAYHSYVERAQHFGNDEVLLIAIADLDLGLASERARLADAVRTLRAMPDIGRVVTILDSGEVRDQDGALVVQNLEQVLARGDPSTTREQLQLACERPDVHGLLISKDCRHAALIVELRRDEQRSVELYPLLVHEVLGVLTAQGFAPERLYRAGWVAVLADIMSATLFNLTRLLPLVAVVLLLTMLGLFRRAWPVLITGLVSMLGVLWTLGFGVLLYGQIDVFMALCPIFILIIACSDVVHMCGAYLHELSRSSTKTEAIERAGAEVGEACLYTSLTTFAGFASMALVPAPVFRQSGVLMGFGVAVSLLLALALCPVLFSLLPAPSPAQGDGGAAPLRSIDRLLHVSASLARTRPRLLVLVFTALAGLSVAGLLQIHIETDFARRLGEDSPLRKSQRFLQENFAGVGSLDVFVDSGVDGGASEPGFLRRVARLQEDLSDLPGVDRVLSVVDPLRQASRALGSESEIPTSAEATAQILLLLEMADDGMLRSVLDDGRRVLRLHLRIQDQGVLATHVLGRQVATRARQFLGAEAQVEVTGLTFLLGGWLDTLVAGQRNALLFALATILAMMILALRSIRAGLWSMVPNVLPLLVLLGTLGWVWNPVDSDAYIVCLVAIGIGVDDTIHFLLRLRRELGRAPDVDRAIEASFAYAGRAIVITSVILVAGFAPLSLASYFTSRIFGTLLPGCLLVALAVVLLLVPALVKLGAFGLPRR